MRAGRQARPSTGWIFAAGCGALLALAWAAADARAQSDSADRSDIWIVAEGGRLSARVDTVPLESVLQAVVAETGLAIEVSGDLGRVRPQEFSGLPLEAALRRLVGDRGLVMVYDRPEGDRRRRLARVRVYGDLTPDPSARQAHVEEARIRAERQAGAPSYRDFAGESRETRLRIIRRLARRKDEATIALLSAVVTQDPEPVIRRVAAVALGDVGAGTAAGVLEQALGDEDADVRIQAMRSLYRVEGEHSAVRLSDLALGDGDAGVRRQAVRLLATLDVKAAWQAIEAARNDPDEAVRSTAERALSRRE